jgi:hypothetical protein
MTNDIQRKGEALLTDLVEILLAGTVWDTVEAQLRQAMSDGRIRAATAEWASRRLPVVAAQGDDRRLEAWGRIVVRLGEDWRTGTWLDVVRGNPSRRARLGYGLLMLGKALVDSGRPGEAAGPLDRGWSLLIKHGSVINQGICMHLRARCAASAARWTECERTAITASALLTQAGAHAEAGQALVLVAQASEALGEKPHADDAVRAAKDCAARAEGEDRARLLVGLADHLRGTGRVQEARQLAEGALATAHGSGSVAAVAAAEDVLARITWRESGPAEAMSLLLQVANRYRAASLVHQSLAAQAAAVEAAAESGHIHEGRALLDLFAGDPVILENPILRARVLFARGKLHLLAGEEVAAGEVYQQGLRILESAGVSPVAAGITVLEKKSQVDAHGNGG